MGRNRGFKLGHRVVRPLTRFTHPRAAAISRLFKWGTKRLSFANRRSSGKYIRVDQEPEKYSVDVPKGHLALYVGEEEDDKCRVIVPVLVFNHPLFADLLMDAEKVYGFDHPGGIQIPCPKSKFDDVKLKMDAARDGESRRQGRRSWKQLLTSSRA